MIKRLLLQLFLFVLLPIQVYAQCSGSSGIPFNCVPAGPMGVNDIVLGGQGANTVKFTSGQLATFAVGAGAPGVFSTLTVTSGGSLAGSFSGNFTFSGNVTFSGAANFAGGLALSNVTLTNSTIQFQITTVGGLPAVTAANAGQTVWITGCRNGSEGAGAGTGCLYTVNDAGTWSARPNPPTGQITVGGQALFLGGSTLNQGNGNRIQLATSTTPGISGQCAQFDSNLNIVPSGAGCGGGSGAGTVSSGTINQLAYYAAAGTTVSGMTVVNSAVLVTSAGGVPSESTTLPAVTCPGCTLSNPSITGTATVVAATFSAALNTAASAAGGANLNIPQGTAPTSPANGNVWATTAGLFGRYNGTTVGPYVGLAQFSATAPITYSNSTGVIVCATCATTTNGGALTATSPMAISAAGVISINEQTGVVALLFNASTPVTNDSYLLYWPWVGGHITAVKYYTGGTSTPSFTVALSVNGVAVTGCSAISVTTANTQASPGTTTCTSTAVTQYQPTAIAISSVAGTPTSALVEVLGTRSAL